MLCPIQSQLLLWMGRMYACLCEFESLIDRAFCVWFGLQTLNASAHPQSLRLHLEVGLQLARGEVPHCRHRVFVIKSHPAANGETTG